MRRAVQTLQYMEGCVDPALYARLSGPALYRAVQALQYTQGFGDPALYAGLYRPCTTHMCGVLTRCVRVLNMHSQKETKYRLCIG